MPSNHFPVLDAWRGLAASLVVLHHFPSTGYMSNSMLARSSGEMVDFFFLLSGFIIAANYRDRIGSWAALKDFMLLRLGRVYPMHLAVLLMWLAVELVGASTTTLAAHVNRAPFTNGFEPFAFVTSLFLVQSLGFPTLVWNTVAWSISTEVWTYLIFGIIVVCRVNLERAAAILVALIASLLVYRIGDRGFPDAALPMLRCVYGFMSGVIVYGAYRIVVDARSTRIDRWSRGWFTLAEAVVCVVAMLVVSADETRERYVWIVPAFVPLLLVFAFNRGAISKVLAWKPFVFLGLISYSVYMIHTFIQVRLMKPALLLLQKWTGFELLSGGNGDPVLIGSGAIVGDLLTLVMFALVVLIASLGYFWIEEPARRWTRTYVARKAGARGSAKEHDRDSEWIINERNTKGEPRPARP
jgi:peptidoglycan/LPS O-acetylase OafA/YrhL